ncbi:radical SAM protein [Velocimicrobium porci]|uniref:Radical SAM protein n=1 Tax=Velocimicrobium porci TaxID=2606634 RepID=A0A6L5XXX2_9FIRM|nr:radical SAM protein [Velocimicrobium porci]MSS63625.1 radical SAM protein [Velocimicrobium porci]
MNYNQCNICPRECKVNRLDGKTGFCKETAQLVVARAALHMWEEPCISGENGSGTVFFSGCNMGCVFCQNKNIATGHAGKVISIHRLEEIFFELKKKGANNINLVTPTHYMPSIVKAIDQAKEHGFDLPFVYNTGGYEKAEAIRNLEGKIDIYLPDFKYYSERISTKYSKAPDYFIQANQALREMVRQQGRAVFDSNGIMKQGVIVRHLLLPGCLDDSKYIIKYLYENYGDSIYISIMNQFTPLSGLTSHPEINRTVTKEEYDELVDFAIEIGVENGFIQEGETQLESFIPEFNGEGV